MAGTTGSRRQQADPRRQAEQAARELLGTRVAAVGDLADAARRRAGATEDVTAARSRADELVRAARRDGDALVEQARADEVAAGGVYAAAFQAAVDAGWTPAQLNELGYLTPPRRRERRAGRTPEMPASETSKSPIPPVDGQTSASGDAPAGGTVPPAVPAQPDRAAGGR
jgi:hypothetical protein